MPTPRTPAAPPTSTRCRARVLLSLALVACSAPGSSVPEASDDARLDQPVPLEVQTAPARDGDLVLWLPTTGQVRAPATVTIRPMVAGTVAGLLVHPGDTVHIGQPLVSLDSTPFDLAVREAEARLEEAEQRLLESIVPESLVTGHPPASARRHALARRAGLPTATVALDRARYDRARTVVTSPLTGSVDRVSTSVGEPVLPGQPLVTVVDRQHLTIEAQVLEHDLPLLRPGNAARITSAASPTQTRSGHISAVLPIVDSLTRAGRVEIPILGDGLLRPGMAAELQLEAVRLRRRRLVPSPAIIERDGRSLVFVVKDNRARWTDVRPGRSNGTETELLPDSSRGDIGVRPGDLVIIDGHLTLAHDALVRVAATRAPFSAPPPRVSVSRVSESRASVSRVSVSRAP